MLPRRLPQPTRLTDDVGMHRFLSLPLVLGSSLLAQQGPKIPRAIDDSPIVKHGPAAAPVLPPQPESAVGLAATETAPEAPWQHDRSAAPAGVPFELPGVLYDAPVAGEIWALAAQWKAGFTQDGVQFVPFFGSDAPRNYPADFRVVGAQVGEVPIDTAGRGVARDGDCVSIARVGLVEQYQVMPAGIEQQFVFEALPARGSLRLQLQVGGGYQVVADGAGWRFVGERGSFGYGAALAIDAQGRSVAMTTRYDAGLLQLEVPADFVQRAQLPLLIDPLIGNVVTLASSSLRHATTDLAYDDSLGRHVACYERVFSQTDSDVIAVRMNNDMIPQVAPFSIDITVASWRACRIANLNAYDKFLIVAESKLSTSAIVGIAGRIYHAGTGTLGAQFDIERGSRSCRKPDVGGDPNLVTPTYWAVVFEREWSASDRDIMMRQVTEAGTLRGNAMTAINSSIDNHVAPAISRSNGDGTASQQAWMVVYRNEYLNSQARLEAKTITWDGQLSDNMVLTGWWQHNPRMALAISSPTSMSVGRRWMIVDGRLDGSSQNMMLYGMVVDQTGNPYTMRAVLTDALSDRSEPVVETDGSRFVLGYALKFVSSSNPDAYARTYDIVLNTQLGMRQLVMSGVDYLGTSGQGQIGISLCSRYSGAGSPHAAQYALAWNEFGANGDRMVGHRFLGIADTGGLSYRATGCNFGGIMVTSSTNFGALGSQNTAVIQAPVGLSGWVIGLPVSQPIPGCPACVQGSSAFVTVLGPQAQMAIPHDAGYLGLTLSMQAFSFGPGSCLGALAFSDTADITIR